MGSNCKVHGGLEWSTLDCMLSEAQPVFFVLHVYMWVDGCWIRCHVTSRWQGVHGFYWCDISSVCVEQQQG